MNRRSDVALGSSALVLGLVIASGSFAIGAGSGYDRIGPRTAPYGVALGLLLLGGALLAPALRRQPDTCSTAPEQIQWRALGALALGGCLFLLLAGHAGFIVAAGLQFWLVARAFSDRRPLRDGVAAVLLAIAVYAGFARGLGLALPAGPLEALLPF